VQLGKGDLRSAQVSALNSLVGCLVGWLVGWLVGLYYNIHEASINYILKK
jgi:hypothetical protein